MAYLTLRDACREAMDFLGAAYKPYEEPDDALRAWLTVLEGVMPEVIMLAAKRAAKAERFRPSPAVICQYVAEIRIPPKIDVSIKPEDPRACPVCGFSPRWYVLASSQTLAPLLLQPCAPMAHPGGWCPGIPEDAIRINAIQCEHFTLFAQEIFRCDDCRANKKRSRAGAPHLCELHAELREMRLTDLGVVVPRQPAEAA